MTHRFSQIKIGEKFRTLDGKIYTRTKTKVVGCCSPQSNAVDENGDNKYFTMHVVVEKLNEER